VLNNSVDDTFVVLYTLQTEDHVIAQKLCFTNARYEFWKTNEQLLTCIFELLNDLCQLQVDVVPKNPGAAH